MADATRTPTPPWRRLAWLELAVVALAALYSLGFYATLPGRLPGDADYDHLVDAIRREEAVGDQAAVAPEWAERARSLLPGLPFVAQPDLTTADYRDVKRLWLIGLPDVPRSDLARVQKALASKLQPDGPEQRFGKLVLQRYLNPTFHEPLFDFTRDVGRAHVYLAANGQRLDCTVDGETHRCNRGPTVTHEWREIDFAPYRCVGANPVGNRVPLYVDYPEAVLGKSLEVMAAVTGEMGWRHTPGLTPVDLNVDIDGQRAGSIHIPVGTVPPQRLHLDTGGLDPRATHDVRFSVVTDNPQDREFCFDARAE